MSKIDVIIPKFIPYTVEFVLNTPPWLRAIFRKFFQIFKMRLLIRFFEKRFKYSPPGKGPKFNGEGGGI